MEKVAELIPGILQSLKEEGLIQQGGISFHSPSELSYIRDWKNITAVQVTLNVFDTRLLQNRLMETLIAQQIQVFVRSIYLQGLLLMDEELLPPGLSAASKYLRKMKTISACSQKSMADLAFSFVRDTPGVTSIIVGAETTDLLKENIAMLHTSPLPEDIRLEIIETFKDVPEFLITPTLWNAKT